MGTISKQELAGKEGQRTLKEEQASQASQAPPNRTLWLFFRFPENPGKGMAGNSTLRHPYTVAHTPCIALSSHLSESGTQFFCPEVSDKHIKLGSNETGSWSV